MKLILLILLTAPFGLCQINIWDPWNIPENNEEEKEDEQPIQNINECNLNTHRGIWSCTKNEENSKLTLTYDCSANIEKKANLWIWSPKFPESMDILNIQNCEELKLYMGYHSENYANDYGEVLKLKAHLGIYFKHLNVINVSSLEIFTKSPQRLQRYPWIHQLNTDDNDPYYDFETDRENYHYYRLCSLEMINFENIKVARIETPIIPEDVTCYGLNSLNFINIGNIDFPYTNTKLLNQHNLKTLIMRNITMNHVIGFIDSVSILDLAITDSKFTSIANPFIKSAATQVVISNNYFEKFLSSDFLQLNADSITFSGNTFELVVEDSFKLISKNITIINNTFYRIEENAFRQISAPVSDPIFNTLSSYTFSNNIIHSLAKDALTISPKNISTNTFFDNVTITNNSINCNCGNMYWFDSLSQKKNDIGQYYFYQRWTRDKNLNKCLNIPNCLVKEILYDLRELCGDDFDCSNLKILKNKSNDDNFYIKQKEHVLSSLMNYNNEMNQNNSNLMQNLIEKIEIKNFQKFSKKPEKKIMKNDSVLINNERKIREKHLWKLSEINVIHSCLFIIVILFCLTICYIVLEKLLKMSVLKVWVLKFWPRQKSVIIEGDVTSSSITDLVPNV